MLVLRPPLRCLKSLVIQSSPCDLRATFPAQLSEVKKGMKRKKAEETAEDHLVGWWHPFSLDPFFDG